MDEAMLKSGQYPNIAIEAGSDPAEVMREHGRKVIPDGEKHELADTREELEADIEMYYVIGIPSVNSILEWLDRQAAITRAEVFENGEYDCMTCDAKAELREHVDELTAERDEWKANAMQASESYLDAKSDRDCLQAKVDELNDNWRKANDGWAEANAEAERWRQKRDQLSRDLDAEHALVVQFEWDNEKLRDTCNTLRASVAGLKMTVERFKARESREPAHMGN